MQLCYSADFGTDSLHNNKKTLPECLPIKIIIIFALSSNVGRQPNFKARKAVFDKLLEMADVANLSKDERVLYDEALKRSRL